MGLRRRRLLLFVAFVDVLSAQAQVLGEELTVVGFGRVAKLGVRRTGAGLFLHGVEIDASLDNLP